jgi:hypothetical protein
LLTRGGLAAAAAVAFGVGCGGRLPEGWVYTTGVTSTAATVVWTGHGDEEVACRGAGGRTLSAPAIRRRNGPSAVRLEGLLPRARYTCRIERPGGELRWRVRFRTAPAGPAPFRFAVVGDTGDGSPQARALARRIRAGRPDFLVHLGDMAYPHGTADEFARRFFGPYRRLLARVPIFPAPGNHDLARHDVYARVFAPIPGMESPRLTYGFDWAGTHLVSLRYRYFGMADTEWLTADLAAAATLRWRFAFLHEPVYPASHKRVTSGLRARLEPLLEAADVALVFAGHQHLYARSEPACEHVPGAQLVQLISGGGGASLDPPKPSANFARVASVTHYLRVSVRPDTLDVRAIGLDGRVIDRARRRRGVALPCRSGGWPAPLEG